jgi:hypothetical protein
LVRAGSLRCRKIGVDSSHPFPRFDCVCVCVCVCGLKLVRVEVLPVPGHILATGTYDEKHLAWVCCNSIFHSPKNEGYPSKPNKKCHASFTPPAVLWRCQTPLLLLARRRIPIQTISIAILLKAAAHRPKVAAAFGSDNRRLTVSFAPTRSRLGQQQQQQQQQQRIVVEPQKQQNRRARIVATRKAVATRILAMIQLPPCVNF